MRSQALSDGLLQGEAGADFGSVPKNEESCFTSPEDKLHTTWVIQRLVDNLRKPSESAASESWLVIAKLKQLNLIRRG